MTISKLTVEVMGESYTIRCDESAKSRLHEAVQELTKVCQKIQQRDVPIPREKVLVVAALNLASLSINTQHQYQQYGQRVELLSEKIDLID